GDGVGRAGLELEYLGRRVAPLEARRVNGQRRDLRARYHASVDEGQPAEDRVAVDAEERLVVEDAEAAAQRRPPIAEHVVGEADARGEVRAGRLEERRADGHRRVPDATQGRNLAGNLGGPRHGYVANARVE